MGCFYSRLLDAWNEAPAAAAAVDKLATLRAYCYWICWYPAGEAIVVLCLLFYLMVFRPLLDKVELAVYYCYVVILLEVD